MRKDDLVPQINQHLDDGNEYTKFVICSENVELYYKQTDRIDASKIYKINLADKHITSHPEVSRNSVPEQLTILNNFFCNIYIKVSSHELTFLMLFYSSTPNSFLAIFSYAASPEAIANSAINIGNTAFNSIICSFICGHVVPPALS